jgi:MinD-like ATPase involved in chromosome partitioning or flagellar assembly
LTKVLAVGISQQVLEWFNQTQPDWDFQTPVDTIDDMWQALNDGVLAQDSQLLIIGDHLAEEDPENEFGLVLASFGRVIPVLVLSYDKILRPEIAENATRARNDYLWSDHRVYFIPVAEDETDIDPLAEIQNNLDDFAEWSKDATPAPVMEDDLSEKKRGFIFASHSAKGGSGKTSVGILSGIAIRQASLAAVAAGLAEKPLSVVVVDLDTRDGQIGFLLAKTAPSALNIAISGDYSEEGIMKNLIYSEVNDVYALLAPNKGSTADFIRTDQYQAIIDRLATMFDVVVLDTSVDYLRTELIPKVVFQMVDAMLYVTTVNVSSIYGMTRWTNEIDQATAKFGARPLDRNKIGVVVNQSMDPAVSGVTVDFIQNAANGLPLLVSIPSDQASAVRAANTNNLVELVRNHPDIAPAYFKLATMLIKPFGYQLVAPYQQQQAGRGRDARPAAQPVKQRAATPTPVAATPVAAEPVKRRGLFRK